MGDLFGHELLSGFGDEVLTVTGGLPRRRPVRPPSTAGRGVWPRTRTRPFWPSVEPSCRPLRSFRSAGTPLLPHPSSYSRCVPVGDPLPMGFYGESVLLLP